MQKLTKYINPKHIPHLGYNESMEINPKLVKESINKIELIIKSFNSREYCTKSCFNLDYMGVLLKFSAYKNLEKADKKEEVLKKCLKSSELNCEDFLVWCDAVLTESQQAQHINHKKHVSKIITEKSPEENIVKLSLVNGEYRQGISPDPMLCLVIAHITKGYKGDYRTLAKFFVDIRDFLQKINNHVNKKIAYLAVDEFVFIDFANCYGWSIEVIDKSLALHDKTTLVTKLQEKEFSHEKLKSLNQELNSELHVLRFELEQLKSSLNDKNSEVAILSERVRAKSNEKNLLRMNTDSLHKQIEKLTLEKKHLNQEIELKESRYDKLLTEYKVQELSKTQLSDESAKYMELERKYEELQSLYKKQSLESAILQNQNETLPLFSDRADKLALELLEQKRINGKLQTNYEQQLSKLKTIEDKLAVVETKNIEQELLLLSQKEMINTFYEKNVEIDILEQVDGSMSAQNSSGSWSELLQLADIEVTEQGLESQKLELGVLTQLIDNEE